MNIFYTSACPVESANNLCKVHINKMYQESIQLLSTALQLSGVSDDALCKPTHQNHPSAIWVRSSLEHYQWLVSHVKALRDLIDKPEHGYDRYFTVILRYAPKIPSTGFSEPPKCINTDTYPELKMIKVFDSVVECYQKYLKLKYHHWTTRTDKRKIKVEFVNGLPDYMKN